MRPNLFLVAAPRSGSTQLSSWLSSHGDVSISRIKEPNFFSSHEFPPEYVALHHLNDVDPARYAANRSKKEMQFAVFREEAHYAYLFEDLETQWRMEASTTYLHCPEAPSKIAEYAPGAKVILLTRDPVSRALSHYRLALRTGRTTRSLREELDAEINGETPLPGQFLLRQSRYEEALERYRAAFPPEDRMEIAFESMIQDPAETLQHVADFLQIDSEGFDTRATRQNAGDAPRFKSLNAALAKSGLKTRLRRLLPVSLKRKLKAVYFKPNTEKASEEDRSLLEAQLGSR